VARYTHTHAGDHAHMAALATLHGYHVVFVGAGIALAAGAVIAGLLLRRGPVSAQDDELASDTVVDIQPGPPAGSLTPIAVSHSGA
jgi:hypothetical protein